MRTVGGRTKAMAVLTQILNKRYEATGSKLFVI